MAGVLNGGMGEWENEKSYRLLLSILRQSKEASKMCDMREKP